MKNLSLIKQIANEIKLNGGNMYFVGGMVRDRILGKQNKDIDVEIHDISVKDTHKILSKYGNISTVGAAFGILMIKGVDIDFAFPRRESKVGNKHTDFSVSVDPYMGLKEAARRRDFTMNAIMQDVFTGEIVDPYNGRQSLNDKQIVFVDKSTYVEDPLRSIRAAQFASRLNFKIDPKVIEIAKTMDYSHLSVERLYIEINKALMSQKPSTAIKYLKEMGILELLFPELNALPENTFNNSMIRLDDSVEHKNNVTNPLAFMYLMMLLDTNASSEYAKISNDKQNYKYISLLAQYKNEILKMSQLSDYHVRKLIVELPINDAITMHQILTHKSNANTSRIRTNVEYLSNDGYGKIKPYYNGHDLIALGFKPGVALAEKLQMLFDLQLHGASKSTVRKHIEN